MVLSFRSPGLNRGRPNRRFNMPSTGAFKRGAHAAMMSKISSIRVLVK
jgi:hypothetical protein